MGGKQDQGKQSSLDADTITGARDIGALKPGKINLIQSYDVGDQWSDRGSKCDGKDDQTPGCFLGDSQR